MGLASSIRWQRAIVLNSCGLLLLLPKPLMVSEDRHRQKKEQQITHCLLESKTTKHNEKSTREQGSGTEFGLLTCDLGALHLELKRTKCNAESTRNQGSGVEFGLLTCDLDTLRLA